MDGLNIAIRFEDERSLRQEQHEKNTISEYIDYG